MRSALSFGSRYFYASLNFSKSSHFLRHCPAAVLFTQNECSISSYKWQYDLSKHASMELPGQKGVRVHNAVGVNPLPETLPHFKHGEKQLLLTAYDCLMHGVEMSPDGLSLGRYVGEGKFHWLKRNEALAQARSIASFLKSRNIKRQQSVGIYAGSSPEWLMTQWALILQSMITVPIYGSLGPESIKHTIKETELTAIFCDSSIKIRSILDDDYPTVKTMIHYGEKIDDPELLNYASKKGVEVLTWPQAVAEGNKRPVKDEPPLSPDEIFVIQYTSGTTGVSKGVVLTHKNAVAAVAGCYANRGYVHPQGLIFQPEDRSFLYLPMAHIYAQICALWYMFRGVQIAFASGDLTKLPEEMAAAEATTMPMVPRVMNRMYAKIVEQTKSGFKGWLFWKCYEGKKKLFQQGIITRESIYDKIVFHKVQKLIGGRVDYMSVGSAPIDVHVLEFWRVVFGALVHEGYGQTETMSVISGALDIHGGNVGHPFWCNYVKLIDVPQMNYLTSNNPPRGEICVKGPNVMAGYYKQPQLTKEAFTDDGWLMTGDIGEFLPDGSLRLIDRRKNIFKLSQGEYVAPEKIEAVYAKCPLVSQVFVDGDSLQSYLVGVVVPDEQLAKIWAAKNGLSKASFQELCSNEAFKKHILESMTEVGKTNKLNSLEQIKSVHLESEAFSTTNGLTTPTFKNKRPELRKRYQVVMQNMYNFAPMIEI